ncbi:MAG: hypothetical protein ACP5LJ_06070 [Candidatus Bipolaricaulaceae bacterium]
MAEEVTLKKALVALVLGWVLASVAVGAPAAVGRVVSVPDGATISVRLESFLLPAPTGLAAGAEVKVRYIGVALPPKPEEAALVRGWNAILVEGKQVFLEFDEKLRDEEGRVLAYVFLDREGKLMVNAILIATELVGFTPVAGAGRYDRVLSHLDRTPWLVPTLACPVVYPWSEAIKHVGESACVEGPVASVGTSRAGDVFLNLGRPYPDTGRFTLFIPARYVGKFEAAFGPRFWNNLLGRTVRAFGEIRLYQGVAEIQLADPANLFIP